MERQALVLYLKNVRDLEVAKHKIYALRNNEYYKYKTEIDKHPISPGNRPTKDKADNLFFWVALFIISVVWSGANLYVLIIEGLMVGGRTALFYILFGLFAAIGIFFIWVSWGAIVDPGKIYKENIDKYDRAVKTSDKNKVIVAKLQNEWKNKDNYYKKEYQKANAILTDFYNMNIIPLPYRDNSSDKNRSLATACYLYDYMRSSQESLQMAFLSNQIEDGIRRIEARLDEIINQLNVVISQQRVMNDKNMQFINAQIAQNNTMINRLKNMETSQRNIEEYTRLSANYNAAQAFFSMAYYLK